MGLVVFLHGAEYDNHPEKIRGCGYQNDIGNELD